MMRRIQRFPVLFFLTCGFLLSLFHAPAFGETTAPPGTERTGRVLRLGIAPFNSTQALMRFHRSLSGYLSRTLEREVLIYTSRGHERFLEDILGNRFDIVISPVHFLPMLADRGFVPLVRDR